MALTKLSSRTAPGDSLVFYFSGHGVQMKDEDGDELDGFDECLVPLDYKENGVIVDDELNLLLVKPLCDGARLHCVIDACHSGTVLDLPFLYKGKGMWRCATTKAVRDEENGLHDTDEVIERKRQREALVVCISGCGDRERSSEVVADGESNGAMTLNLLRAIQEKKQITYKKLLKAIRGGIRTAERNTIITNPAMILTGRSLSLELGVGDKADGDGLRSNRSAGDTQRESGGGVECAQAQAGPCADHDDYSEDDDSDDDGQQPCSACAPLSGVTRTSSASLCKSESGPRSGRALSESKENDPLPRFLSCQFPHDDVGSKMRIARIERCQAWRRRSLSLGVTRTEPPRGEEEEKPSLLHGMNRRSLDCDIVSQRQEVILKQSKGLGLLIHGAQIPQLSASRKFDIKNTVLTL
ncbi:hypothetical protein CBR_g24422 [Chara braunii]|uniref:Peptidase C14 caspase domain-containing protein n=1 Tax=Chara braunii TaxID=69332 RepID=A0A388JMN1_CHABU|nr:hypothetical protein CBR_g24422 [Chara braunii]|eukprot:GBG59079.1 hypothetical protein CBR_g24422 [Chara braunii]